MIGKVAPIIASLAKALLASVAILVPLDPCTAQTWFPWDGNFFDTPPGYRERTPHRPERKSSQKENIGKRMRLVDTVKDGGPRPEIAPKAPSVVAFPYSFPVGQS